MRKVLFVVMSCLVACGGPVEGEVREDELGVQRDAIVVSSAFYAGSTVTLGAGANDAVWIVNQSDALWPQSTRLTATVAHGGALNVANSGLDHIAISVRGMSADAGLQYLGLPLQTGTFLFGETVSSSGMPPMALRALTSGRGVTFWAVGAQFCADKTRPCALFENYTYNWDGPGLILRSVPLNVTSAPFNVTLTADAYDMSFSVTQDGVVKGSASCRSLTASSLCTQQPMDAGAVDAFVAFVNAPAIAGRTVGATSIQVTHSDPPLCPNCQPN
ncbi:hypothetical protein [Hyalangium versicolor]|uniref:hypothetical protein n=1 Tax=Hyalangium versicolor TaxID=2861190 RepID=UPI001CCB154C|nr:hypothetical protein [Hyalangium versicolor]